MTKWEALAFISFCVCVASAVTYCYTHQQQYDCAKITGEVKLFADKCVGTIYSNYSQCLDTAKEIYCEVK